MAIPMPCNLQLSPTTMVDVFMTESDLVDGGIHIQRKDDSTYLSVLDNNKHVYWSKKRGLNQVFTVDSDDDNKLISYYNTYLSNHVGDGRLWQIFEEYKDDEEYYAVRVANDEKDDLLNLLEEELEEELLDDEDNGDNVDEDNGWDYEDKGEDEDEDEDEEEIQDDSHPDEEEEIQADCPVEVEEVNKDEPQEEDTVSTDTTSSSNKKAPPPSMVALKNFMEAKRQFFQLHNPGMKKGDLTKEMKRAWKEDLSKEDKKKFYPTAS